MKTETLRKLLAKPELCAIYHLPSSGVGSVQDAADSLDYPSLHVNLRDAAGMPTILSVFGEALDFPEWYGANLDALKDCLADLSWREAPGYVLIITGADALHATGGPFRQLNEVLATVIEEWRAQGIPFWVFYDLRADGLATLPTVT